MAPSLARPQIEEAHTLGLTRWPSIAIALRDFEARLEILQPRPSSLAQHPEDLFMACACGMALPAALACFERDYLRPALTALRRFGSSQDFVEEVCQSLRAKLFLGTPPRIDSYAGNGPLLAWVRIGLTRSAIDLLRQNKRYAPLDIDIADQLIADATTPESHLLQNRSRQSLKAAIESTLNQLTPRDRTLLRLHFLDGMNIDRVAALFHIHRATVARRIVHLRRDILAAVRRTLPGSASDADSSEVHSLWRLVGSDVQVSLERLLKESLDAPPTAVTDLPSSQP